MKSELVINAGTGKTLGLGLGLGLGPREKPQLQSANWRGDGVTVMMASFPDYWGIGPFSQPAIATAPHQKHLNRQGEYN